MAPWYIGNTSVRSAMRLRDALVALSTSSLQGNLRGQKGDVAFRELLGQHGIVTLGEDKTNSVGRKWRSALEKLGFLYPNIPKSDGVNQNDLGRADTITPNGWRLIRAETVPAMQECFLRALAAQYIKVRDKNDELTWFSPLRYTLALLLELENQTGQASVSFIEIALCVQTSNNSDDLSLVAREIMALREERDKALIKRRFDSEKYGQAAKAANLEASTFRDYADANIRYLKATGIVQSKGRGVALTPEKRLFADLIAKDATVPSSNLEQYKILCEGAALPTDSHDAALTVLFDLVDQLGQMGISYSIGGRPIDTPADIAIIRYEIEDIVSKQKEEIFASEQISQWHVIADYIDLIASRKDRKYIDEDTEIIIPRTEAPAYLEWVLWRAFLAVDSLRNKPYEARRFNIDQDFLPVSAAPGNGPDMIMEFQDFVIVIEVTLTESSRQEAAEGEPVRRHIADVLEKYVSESGKPVYGLFIANRIDSNTAETFRIGVWYTREDERLELKIVPLTIAQFSLFFRALFETNKANPHAVLSLLEECDISRSVSEAPEWKEEIERVVRKTVKAIYE